MQNNRPSHTALNVFIVLLLLAMGIFLFLAWPVDNTAHSKQLKQPPGSSQADLKKMKA
jgi:hypothetical protein